MFLSFMAFFIPSIQFFLRCPTPRLHRFLSSHWPSFRFLSFMAFFIPSIQFSYAVRHLDSTASYLPTGQDLGFFRSWPSLFIPSSFSSVFLVLSFVSASTSMLFWAIFLLPFFEHGRTMWARGEFKPRQTRQLPRAVDLKGWLLSCQSY